MLRLGGDATNGSAADSGYFCSDWVRSDSFADVGFFYIIPETNKYKTNINIILGSIILPLGKRTNIAKYYNKYVRIIQVINYAKYFRINFIRNGKAYYADSRDKTLFYSIHRLNHFPINFKITKYDWRIYTKSKKEKVKPQT